MASETINRETALGLLNYATSYMDAAEHLVFSLTNGKLRLRFDAPVELLVGHGVEILLKSYLRSKDCSEETLRKYGHNLEGLLTPPNERGLGAATTTNELGHLQLLNQRFGKARYTVRYLVTGSYTAHDDCIVLNWARNVEKQIGPLLKPTTAFRR